MATITDIQREVDRQPLEWSLQRMCFIADNRIYLEYPYFKFLAQNTSHYDSIRIFLLQAIESMIKTTTTFDVSINMKYLTIGDIDRHRSFIYNIVRELSTRYPDSLNRCNIYNAPFIIKNLLLIISPLLDRKNQDKINVISASSQCT